MNKLYYFVIIAIGLSALMLLIGIKFTGQDTLMNLFGVQDPKNLKVQTSWFLYTLGLAFGVASVIGSIFSKESSIRAGFIVATGVTGVGVGAFVGILNKVYDLTKNTQDTWIFYFTFLIFIVYIVGFVLSLIEFYSEG